MQVQEAADCLGVECEPRYVEIHEMVELRDLNWGEWQVRSLQPLRAGIYPLDYIPSLQDALLTSEHMFSRRARQGVL